MLFMSSGTEYFSNILKQDGLQLRQFQHIIRYKSNKIKEKWHYTKFMLSQVG